MKRSMLLLFVLFIGMSWLPAETVKIKVRGFGELTVEKTGNEFTVELKKLGKFTFSGNISGIDSFNLTASVEPATLNKFPGSAILSLLSLKKVELTLTRSGLKLSSEVDPGKGLKNLFATLKIPSPRVEVSASIGAGGIELEGAISYSPSGLTLPLVPPLGTEFTYDRLSLTFSLGRPESEEEKAFGASSKITVLGKYHLRPTKWDDSLAVEAELTYDLASQQIEIAGSLTDKWKNPFGIDKLLKKAKDEISIDGAAFSIGWVPGSPTPTKLGIYAKNMHFFNIRDCSFAMDIDPSNAKGAYMFEKSSITLNDLKNIAFNGLGALLPDIFPTSLNLKNVKILFSPTGGKVGAFSIDKGFELRGEANFGSAAKGMLNISASFDSGIHLEASFESRIRELLLEKLDGYPKLKSVMKVITKTLNVRKIKLLLEVNRDQFQGAFDIDLTVAGFKVAYSAEGTVHLDKLAETLKEKVWEGVKDLALDIYNKAKETSLKAYRKTKDAVSKVMAAAWQAIKDFGTAVKHVGHSHDKCLNECVPNYANHAGQKTFAGGQGLIDQYLKELKAENPYVPDLDPAEIVKIKDEIRSSHLNPLVSEINKHFDDVKNDDHVRLFFTLPGSKNEGERKFEKMIQEYKDKFNQYVEDQFNRLFL